MIDQIQPLCATAEIEPCHRLRHATVAWTRPTKLISYNRGRREQASIAITCPYTAKNTLMHRSAGLLQGLGDVKTSLLRNVLSGRHSPFVTANLTRCDNCWSGDAECILMQVRLKGVDRCGEKENIYQVSGSPKSQKAMNGFSFPVLKYIWCNFI